MKGPSIPEELFKWPDKFIFWYINCFHLLFFDMGNNAAAHPSTFKDFPMQKYINQGVRQQEIIKIK